MVTYFMLWKAYKHVAALRAEALMSSEEVLPEQFAILVRDIPSPPNGETQKEFVDSYFRDIYPETFYRSLVVTENSKVIYLSICLFCSFKVSIFLTHWLMCSVD